MKALYFYTGGAETTNDLFEVFTYEAGMRILKENGELSQENFYVWIDANCSASAFIVQAKVGKLNDFLAELWADFIAEVFANNFMEVEVRE